MARLLTCDETAHMQKEFLAMDTDGQGTISVSEWKDLMVSQLGVLDVDAADIFDAVDAHHDREIHYSEFLAAMLSTRADLHNQHLSETFRNFDTDLSGYITAENLRENLGNFFEGKPVESLVKEADFSMDGRVSFQEFSLFMRGTPLDRYNMMQIAVP